MAIALVGCQRHEPARIDFALQAPAQIAQCNTGLTVKWYGYDFKLRTAAGDWVAFQLADDLPVELVALGCGKDAASTASLRGSLVSAGPFTGLRFTVGVPPQLNHENPVLASPPLNRSDMFWVWQQGYKFLSIDAADGTVLHLGSTGCSGPAPIRPPTSSCEQPNRLTVTLHAFDPSKHRVSVEPAALIAPLGNGARCTGNYAANNSCRDAVQLLGLNLETGACNRNCGQVLFTTALQ